MVGTQYGWVQIINPQKRWSQNWNHCYVQTRCTSCQSEQWQSLNALTSGKSRGCQQCSEKDYPHLPRWLDRRLTAAKQRCRNPKDRAYELYGARGIEFRFDSVMEAGLWILDNVAQVRRDWELDRIDTNGHYERGNLRFVPKTVNQGNRRITLLSTFDQRYWPYARSTTSRMLSQGQSRAEIIHNAQVAVKGRRKNWRLIQARLEFMTYEMPDHITVLPYRTA